MKDVYRQYYPNESAECPAKIFNLQSLQIAAEPQQFQPPGTWIKKKRLVFCLGPASVVAVVRTPAPTGFGKAAWSRIIG